MSVNTIASQGALSVAVRTRLDRWNILGVGRGVAQIFAPNYIR